MLYLHLLRSRTVRFALSSVCDIHCLVMNSQDWEGVQDEIVYLHMIFLNWHNWSGYGVCSEGGSLMGKDVPIKWGVTIWSSGSS